MRKLLFLFFTFYFSIFTLSAQRWLWGKQGKLAFDADAFGSVVATNKNGDAYVAGDYWDTIVFGTDTLKNSIGNMFLVKYNLAGTELWAERSAGYCNPYAITTDIAGNVLVTGWFQDSVLFGTKALTSFKYTRTTYVVKYNASGNVLWARQAKGISRWSDNSSSGITTDANGNIYITGTFSDTVSFGAYTLRTYGPYMINGGVFLVKYDSSGNVLWAKQSVTPSSRSWANAGSVTVDKSGNPIICGSFGDTVTFGSNTLKNGSVFVAKYDAAGNVLWAQQSASKADSIGGTASSVAIDNADNIYVAGGVDDTILFGPYILASKSVVFGETFLVKYNAGGNLLWAEQSQGVKDGEYGVTMCSDGNSHLYMAINADTVQFKFGGATIGTVPYNPATPYSIAIAELDTSGTVLCSAIFGISKIVRNVNGIACDNTGNYVYTSGTIYKDKLVFSNDTLVATTGRGLPYVASWVSCRAAAVMAAPSDTCLADFTVPNIFTPNGDGINDVFAISDTNHFDSYSMTIYDRWGQVEFYSTSPNVSWDGRNNGGVEVSDGVYYYILKATCGNNTYNKKGFLHLLR